MFEAVFGALKRAIDQSLIPLLLSSFYLVIEKLFDALSWFLIKLADLGLGILVGIINTVPFPTDALDIWAELGPETVALIHATGVVPAALVYISGLGVAFVVRIATLGIGTR